MRLSKDSKTLEEIIKTIDKQEDNGEIDFYLKYDVLNLLNNIAGVNKNSEIITLVTKNNILKTIIIELLDEEREILKNEGLLLLAHLSEKNIEIQKILVFENTIEKIFKIIKNENNSALFGSVVIFDLINFLINLLKYNISNQNYFSEVMGFDELHYILLKTKIEMDNVPNWSNNEQNVINFIKFVELLNILCFKDEANTIKHQDLIRNNGILLLLIQNIPILEDCSVLKAHLIFTVGHIILTNESNKKYTNEILCETNSSLMDLIVTSASNTQPFHVQLAALFLFKCYVSGDYDIQLAMASTLNTPLNDDESTLTTVVGHIITSCFTNVSLKTESTLDGVRELWISCALLSNILDTNKDSKEYCLKINTTNQVSLFQTCLNIVYECLNDNKCAKVAIAILSLVCVWMFNCSYAVKEFLKTSTNLQLVITK